MRVIHSNFLLLTDKYQGGSCDEKKHTESRDGVETAQFSWKNRGRAHMALEEPLS